MRFLITIFFISFIYAMEDDNQTINNDLSPDIKKAGEELNKYLTIEKILPGNFGYTIFKSLKSVAGNNIYPYYFGIQTSSTLSGPSQKMSLPSFLWDWRTITQYYDREDAERVNLLSSLKDYKKSKNQEINLKFKSELQSDNNKKLKINNKDIHIDTNRSIYEALREIYKTKKNTKIEEKNFSIKHDFNSAGFKILKNKKNPHLLEQIMVRNFKGLLENENNLTKNVFSFKVLEWIYKIFNMVASLEIEKTITPDKTLYENQSKYNTFCCLYEAYHHLMFVLLAGNEKRFYTYNDYKKAVAEEDKSRLPGDIKDYVLDHIVCKSGMDAITKSFLSTDYKDNKNITEKYKMEIVPIYHDERNKDWAHGEDIYYEVGQHLKYNLDSKIPVIISGITSALYKNTQPHDYNPKIIETVKESIKKNGETVLILDSTIQIDDPQKNDPIYAILENNNIKQFINDGTLVVMLAKSFQKFATLGTQKMRAGDITVIGKKDGVLSNSILKDLHEKYDDLYKENTWGSELQWLTHLLKYNYKDELLFLGSCRQAVERFVNFKRLLNDDQINKIIENNDKKEFNKEIAQKQINFLIAQKQINFLYDQKHKKTFSMLFIKIPDDRLISLQGKFPHNNSTIINNLQSFAYITTGLSQYPYDMVRLNIGLEPDALLAQIKQYGFTSVNLGQKGAFNYNYNLFFSSFNHINYVQEILETIKEKSILIKENFEPHIVQKIFTNSIKSIAYYAKNLIKNSTNNEIDKLNNEIDKLNNKLKQKTEEKENFDNEIKLLKNEFATDNVKIFFIALKKEIINDIKKDIGEEYEDNINNIFDNSTSSRRIKLLAQYIADYQEEAKKDLSANSIYNNVLSLLDMFTNIKNKIKSTYETYYKDTFKYELLKNINMIKNKNEIYTNQNDLYKELKSQFQKETELNWNLDQIKEWEDCKKYITYKVKKDFSEDIIAYQTFEEIYKLYKEDKKEVVEPTTIQFSKLLVLIGAIYDLKGVKLEASKKYGEESDLYKKFNNTKNIIDSISGKILIITKEIENTKKEKDNLLKSTEISSATGRLQAGIFTLIKCYNYINEIFKMVITDKTLIESINKINSDDKSSFEELNIEDDPKYEDLLSKFQKINNYYDKLSKVFTNKDKHLILE